MGKRTFAFALIAVSGLLTACTGSDGGLIAETPTAGTLIGVTSPNVSASTAKACNASIGWTVTTPNGDSTTYPVGTSLTLLVGDRMQLSAAPGCQMSFSAQQRGVGVLRHVHHTAATFLAVGPGQARVLAFHAMCDGSAAPDCLGGLAVLPDVTVHVSA